MRYKQAYYLRKIAWEKADKEEAEMLAYAQRMGQPPEEPEKPCCCQASGDTSDTEDSMSDASEDGFPVMICRNCEKEGLGKDPKHDEWRESDTGDSSSTDECQKDRQNVQESSSDEGKEAGDKENGDQVADDAKNNGAEKGPTDKVADDVDFGDNDLFNYVNPKAKCVFCNKTSRIKIRAVPDSDPNFKDMKKAGERLAAMAARQNMDEEEDPDNAED